ncbi:MAG: hypothetical protein WC794_02005 [Candidatus Doudnabacteria bacterium]|jgi:hypothetical protein
MDRAIITSASSKFFPSLINLLGSIKKNYPAHPTIFVYDIGLFWTYRKELGQIEGVRVLDMPHFSPFWRQSYTWKTYILAHPLARLNFYVDAGCQILRPLDEIFLAIERDDYLAVNQDSSLDLIAPKEYRSIFSIDEKYYQETCVTAGIVGFKDNSRITPVTKELFDAALSGLCLGLSKKELFRNKGAFKSIFVRNCEIFRQDTTLFSMLMRKHFGDFIIQNVNKFGSPFSDKDHPEQLIWNIRLNFLTLEFLKISYTHGKVSFLAGVNRLIIFVYLNLRIIRLFFKGKTKNIIGLKKQS